MAMKVVRQARLELSGGSTPDQLRPPPLQCMPECMFCISHEPLDQFHDPLESRSFSPLCFLAQHLVFVNECVQERVHPRLTQLG